MSKKAAKDESQLNVSARPPLGRARESLQLTSVCFCFCVWPLVQFVWDARAIKESGGDKDHGIKFCVEVRCRPFL